VPARLSGLFITGTDTGVGKTTVGRALLVLARRSGRRPIPFKPAETGCDPEPSDALALWNAAGRPTAPERVCLYRFATPVAPAVAAGRAGVTIALAAIVAHAAQLAAEGDGLLVEGAGGLLVPYAPRLTGADIAAALGLPVLVVARDELGTINHTALTLAEIDRRGLPTAGVLLCETRPRRTPDQLGNADAIEALTGLRPLGTIPHLPDASDDMLADRCASTLASLTCYFGGPC